MALRHGVPPLVGASCISIAPILHITAMAVTLRVLRFSAAPQKPTTGCLGPGKRVFSNRRCVALGTHRSEELVTPRVDMARPTTGPINAITIRHQKEGASQDSKLYAVLTKLLTR